MRPYFAILAASAVLASAAAPAADQRGGREQQLVVSAFTGVFAPVTDLTAADVIVREDGLAREVVQITAAPPPSHLVLLVDDSQASQPAVPYLRTALAGFIRRVSGAAPAPQLSLWTFGERPTRRADFLPTSTAAEKAAASIFPTPGAGAYFLQAVTEAARDLAKRSATHPVIVAFVAESGPEFSNDTRTQVAAALETSGASLWIVALQDARNDDLSPEAMERAAVIGDVTTNSGGLTRTVLSGQGIEPAFDGLAALLTSRLLVTYGRPDQLIPPKALEVTTRRPGVRLAFSHWLR
jgi:hypothetical protein